MEKKVLKQKGVKLSDTGSFMSWMMSSNSSYPEVGKGATILYWSDREAYEVLKVSDDGKRCTLRRYKPDRTDDNGMSESQSYRYETLEGKPFDILWRWGAWRTKVDNRWHKINIIFGVKREYYDYSF